MKKHGFFGLKFVLKIIAVKGPFNFYFVLDLLVSYSTSMNRVLNLLSDYKWECLWNLH